MTVQQTGETFNFQVEVGGVLNGEVEGAITGDANFIARIAGNDYEGLFSSQTHVECQVTNAAEESLPAATLEIQRV